MEKLSIIVPIYNMEAYLERCLTSLIAESYPDVEFILVNDGSTDRSEEICKLYCERDNRFKYVFQTNQGVSAARNNGIRNSSGKWIGFCDSDDWVVPDYYTHMMNCAQNADCDCVIAGYTITDGSQEKAYLPVKKSAANTQDIQDFVKVFWENCDRGILNAPYNKLFIREKITSGFDEGMTCGEDLDFCLKYLQQAKEIAFADNAGYMYFKQNTNVIKYRNNTAKQCAKYSSDVGDFLALYMDEQEYGKAFQKFVCGNVCRDVGILAKNKPYREALRLIREFHSFPLLSKSVNREGWKDLGKKYQMVGILFSMRWIALLILCAKLA